MDISQNPIADLEAAFNSIGASMYPDEFAAELLAWFHCVGGSNEAVVLNPALNGALMACAKKMKIEGGSIPDPDLIRLWKSKMKELAEGIDQGAFPEWLIRICDRYDLKLPEPSRDFIQADLKDWSK